MLMKKVVIILSNATYSKSIIQKGAQQKGAQQKGAQQNAVYGRSPSLRMDLEWGNQLFLSRNIFYGISMLIVRSGHSKKLE